MSKNPYHDRPSHAFWNASMAGRGPESVDLVGQPPFRIQSSDRIATAGSCFAQHIARLLAAEGFAYFVAEREPATPGAIDENYRVFSARYGNIYTPRQLLQLFERAYSVFEPAEDTWARSGACVDPFRPRIQEAGFSTVEDLVADRASHLACVRTVFEQCDVFVFTLGLTEAWVNRRDGAVYPLAPGVGGTEASGEYDFHNFGFDEVRADLAKFVDHLSLVNPRAKVILTVSPVALQATFEDTHVLLATTYSKSILRAAAEEVVRASPHVAYFPSYEMITGPHAPRDFWEDDLRQVSNRGVLYAMSSFKRAYLAAADESVVQDKRRAERRQEEQSALRHAESTQLARTKTVICDEEAIELP